MSVMLDAMARFKDAEGKLNAAPLGLLDLLWGLVPELAAAGFDHVLTPPLSKAQGGDGDGCDGDGVYDLWDLGNKSQQGSTATRYGTIHSARRLSARLHAYGMGMHANVVLHQRDGGENGHYKFLGADRKTLNGRGALTLGCFRKVAGGAGTQPQDDVPSPEDDKSYGDETCYQNCDPAGYTLADALAWGNWCWGTLDLDGGRLDDGKGLWPELLRQFVSYERMAGKLFAVEYYDGNPAHLNSYVNEMGGAVAVEDFSGMFAVAAMCNGYTTWPLSGGGYNNWNSTLSRGMVKNADTDYEPGANIITNTLLGYAYKLTTNDRDVMVFIKDYLPDSVLPGSYGLKPQIDNLVWINRNLAYGAQSILYNDGQLYIHERNGDGGEIGSSPGLLVAINVDTWNNRAAWVPTCFGPNVQLHDYAGHGPDIWTNEFGWAYVGAPANAYSRGESYCCYSRAGQSKPNTWTPRRTTQSFYGADDLDIPAASRSQNIVGEIYVAAGEPIKLTYPPTIRPVMTSPALMSRIVMNPFLTSDVVLTKSGSVDLSVFATDPNADPVNYELIVEYMGG